jgi:predicted transcriptional regulator of viral defense system
MNTRRQATEFDDEAFLAANPVFTLDALEAAMGAGRSRKTAQSWVKYHLGTGRLAAVERAVYAAVPPGVDSNHWYPDPFLAASAVRPDGVFAYHSALQLLGAAHSEWNRVIILTTRRRRPIRLGTSTLDFSPHPVPLATAGKERMGVRELQYRVKTVTTTGPERTLVDGFRQPRSVGGLEELVESAAGFVGLDFRLLEEVLAAYGQKALWAAVGWFLERYQQTFYVPDAFLEKLERNRPASPHYLPRRTRGSGGVMVKRWHVVLPASVVRLAEPNAG